MKKLILLAIAVLLLAGCSGYNSFLYDMTHPWPADDPRWESGGGAE